MSKQFHIYGTLSITDHQFKALSIVLLNAIIALLSYVLQNPTLQLLNFALFILQLLASAALLLEKNGTVTNSETRFLLYVLAQFIFTFLQNIPQSLTSIGDQAAKAILLAALLQAFLSIEGILEGEWSVSAPASGAATTVTVPPS